MMHGTPFPSVTKEPYGLVMIEQTVLIWLLLIIIIIIFVELFLMTALKNICYTVYILFYHEQENFFAIQYFLIQCSNIGVV